MNTNEAIEALTVMIAQLEKEIADNEDVIRVKKATAPAKLEYWLGKREGLTFTRLNLTQLKMQMKRM